MFWVFKHLNLGFVSYFDIRISNLVAAAKGCAKLSVVNLCALCG